MLTGILAGAFFVAAVIFSMLAICGALYASGLGPIPIAWAESRPLALAAPASRPESPTTVPTPAAESFPRLD